MKTAKGIAAAPTIHTFYTVSKNILLQNPSVQAKKCVYFYS